MRNVDIPISGFLDAANHRARQCHPKGRQDTSEHRGGIEIHLLDGKRRRQLHLLYHHEREHQSHQYVERTFHTAKLSISLGIQID